MKEFNLKSLFIKRKDLFDQKEELLKSPSWVIMFKLLHFSASILFSTYNVYCKVVFRGDEDALGKGKVKIYLG